MRLLILFLFLFVSTSRTIDTEEELNKFHQSSPLNVLVFVEKNRCQNENDLRCREEKSQLERLEQLTTSEKINFAVSKNLNLAEKYFNLYSSSLPKLCFFRQGLPVIYPESISDVDAIHEWLSETRQRLTRSLDDQSFEHDTQAATGSTTGDWFILFKKSNESKSLIPIWESLSFHYRNRVIFAYVNIDENPMIQQRFHLFNLPTFILFKRGQMYRYESSSWKEQSFIDFIDRPYDRVKGEVVPPELKKSYFGSISFYLIVIPMLCLVIVLLVLISGLTKSKSSTCERRTPIQVKID